MRLRLKGASGNSLVCSPCSKQGQLEKAAQGSACLGFEYVEGWRLQTSVGNLLQCLTTLTVKKDFADFPAPPSPSFFLMF